MKYEICKHMCLDIGDTAGPTSEVGQVVAISGMNACQLEFIVFALEGTSPEISAQLEYSNDLENWKAIGAAVTASSIGRTQPSAQTSVSAAYVRYKFTISGTNAKAVFAATLNLSSQ